MAKDSAAKTQKPKSPEPKSPEESKQEKPKSSSSSFPEDEEEEDYEEEYLEVDPKDLEEVDVDNLEGVDLDDLYQVVDEEYEEVAAGGPDGEDDAAAEKREPESEDESEEEGTKTKPKSFLASSSDEEEEKEEEDSDDSDSDDSYDDEDEDDEEQERLDEKALKDDSPENNIRLVTEALEAKPIVYEGREPIPIGKDLEDELVYEWDRFDFPEDPEGWREEDLRELWADAPFEMKKPGWDPVWADEYDWKVMKKVEAEGNDPPIAPFYLPYRRPYPVIPDNHPDILSPKSVIEELDRIEEFLKWVSYIFPDGSS